MFEDADRDALTSANYRALGIYQDLDSISYGISNGSTKTEPNKAKLARVALDAKVTALAAAVAGADEAVAAQLQATFAQIDDELAAMQVQIGRASCRERVSCCV